MQEDTRPQRPEESTEEYLGYLHSVPLDKEKYEKMSETEKVAATAIGTGLLMKNIYGEIVKQYMIVVIKLYKML